ncbi:AraC family transcriptional regulator [Haliea atlantica]|jgi:AraC-like DNA-binding protein|tara:strand:- start:4834 stop:5991 length:1158 start_codon:yes stop_codon:yes gene_type:complete
MTLTETTAISLLSQGLLLAVILWVLESRQAIANRLLACLLLAMTTRLLALILSEERFVQEWRTEVTILHNTVLLIGPFLYLYARSLVHHPTRLQSRDIWHGLPFLLAITWNLVARQRYLLPLDDPDLIQLTAQHGLASSVSLLTYGLLTLRLLQRYRLSLLDKYTAIERISLDWLRNIAGLVLLLAASGAGLNLLRLAAGWPPDPARWIVLPASAALFYGVAIFGFRQSLVLFQRSDRSSAEAGEEPEGGPQPSNLATQAPRYQRSGLDPDRAARLWDKLQRLMQTEQLHLQPELQVDTLAVALGVRQQTLSEVLNTHAGMRFYDYINGLRVEEARRLMIDPQNAGLSLLDIAMAAGFSSKSTFNKYFKQVFEQTPSEYRRQHMP